YCTVGRYRLTDRLVMRLLSTLNCPRHPVERLCIVAPHPSPEARGDLIPRPNYSNIPVYPSNPPPKKSKKKSIVQYSYLPSFLVKKIKSKLDWFGPRFTLSGSTTRKLS